jgi:ADP-ribosylglycohydrolase
MVASWPSIEYRALFRHREYDESSAARFEETGDPFSGSTSPNAAGNGSLMRLAPVAMFYVSQPEEGIAACGESSRTTHGAREAIDACRYFGGLLIGQ